MFTGIIECLGKVVDNQKINKGYRLTIDSEFQLLNSGESIAINGVCLTYLPQSRPGILQFDISPETLEVSNLGLLQAGDFVNLERALAVGMRFGGHYVNGHVDSRATILSLTPVDEFTELKIGGFKQGDYPYLIPKGSIAIDGISLTINSVSDEGISLMLVPHTLSHTTLKTLKPNTSVNIEFDYMAKIVAHQLQIAGLISQTRGKE